jgi:Uncharacterized conserved protein
MSVADTKIRTTTTITLPNMYKVVLHNDDFTPFDFVVVVLTDIFDKDHSEAHDLALTVHNEERAVIGIYTKEIAETKVSLTRAAAKAHGHPLQLTVEPM